MLWGAIGIVRLSSEYHNLLQTWGFAILSSHPKCIHWEFLRKREKKEKALDNFQAFWFSY